MSIVDAADRARLKRLLLIGALLLGVVAMHALAITDQGPTPPDRHSNVSTMPAAMDADPMGIRTERAPRPISMPHDLLHLCLAVLAAVVMFALAAVAFAVLTRHRRRTEPRRARGMIILQARPPPRTAVRLSQLCMLRT